MEERKYESNHNVTIESRERMNVTGVTDVSEFNEYSIILETEMGIMTIEGEGLKIEQLSTQTTEMRVSGDINSIVYSDDDIRSGHRSFWGKIFK